MFKRRRFVAGKGDKPATRVPGMIGRGGDVAGPRVNVTDFVILDHDHRQPELSAPDLETHGVRTVLPKGVAVDAATLERAIINERLLAEGLDAALVNPDPMPPAMNRGDQPIDDVAVDSLLGDTVRDGVEPAPYALGIPGIHDDPQLPALVH